jgi:putative endonuclease
MAMTSQAQAARRALGRRGEDVAVQHLTAAGWTIVDRNVRTPEGEIDVVGHDGDCLVFVEVRARATSTFGTPEESVTPAKARRLARCALSYLAAAAAPQPSWRVDLIAIRFERGRVSRLEHYQHALQ